MIVKNYLRPSSIEQAYSLLVGGENRHLIAGGAWMKLTLKEADHLIELCGIVSSAIEDHPDYVAIGAMSSLERLVESPLIAALSGGILAKAASSIMGPAVRNIATIGGSVAGGYAFSDLLVALLAMDATLVYYKQGIVTLKDMLEQKRVKDILLEVRLPKTVAKATYTKLSKTALDFAILSVAVLKTETELRIVAGSRPNVAKRAVGAEAWLKNQINITCAILAEAAAMAAKELQFGANIRASEFYRNEVGKVTIERGLKEVYGLCE
jgi:CO/xanthine dehydrogenase FAD-binding subunit